MQPELIKTIYRYFLVQNGNIENIKMFINSYYTDEYARNLPIGVTLDDLIKLWPEFIVAASIREFIIDE